jgi:hypothetical protein
MENEIDKNITVNLYKEQIEWIRKECYMTRKSRNELLREIVNYYIEKKGEEDE